MKTAYFWLGIWFMLSAGYIASILHYAAICYATVICSLACFIKSSTTDQ